MNKLFDQMLQIYNTNTIDDKNNAVKEIMQEIVLCGLSRANFFDKAVFYGGTALRIFYGLDRFSEDLDFSLKVADENFDLKTYFPVLQKEIQSYGLNLKIEEKVKSADTAIKSAFLKGNTKEHLLMFYADSQIPSGINSKQTIKIKFEVDVNPPAYATFEHKYRLLPRPYKAELYDIPSLFAGKIHAVICRAWKTRVKGRDLYDYIFYLQKNSTVNLKHLNARLAQSGFIQDNKPLTINEVKNALYKRFDSIDYLQAITDVAPFVSDKSSLDIWSADLFKQITSNLKSNE